MPPEGDGKKDMARGKGILYNRCRAEGLAIIRASEVLGYSRRLGEFQEGLTSGCGTYN